MIDSILIRNAINFIVNILFKDLITWLIVMIVVLIICWLIMSWALGLDDLAYKILSFFILAFLFFSVFMLIDRGIIAI